MMLGAAARRLRALQPGHRLKLLKGGLELFPAMVETIDAARSEVLLETYIFEFGGLVLQVAEALERAAARGLTVRVVVDGFGTGSIPPAWQQRWRAAGLEWRVFNPTRGWTLLLPARWRRLHRKLCVVDGRVAFCGGINLLDDLFDPTFGSLKAPRLDFAVRVVGPLVDDVHRTMERVWFRMQAAQEARHLDLDGALQSARRAAGGDGGEAAAGQPADRAQAESAHATSGADDGAAMLVLRDNVRFRRRIESTYRLAVAQAREEILIANAYFIPGIRLQRSLLRAARRGVRVTLLLQGRYEYFMQYHGSRAVYSVLLAAGIRIIEYEPSFLHAKVAVMDGVFGAWSTVGSSNLDPLSLLLAREANVFVRDDRFAAELRLQLLDAIEHHGREVEADAHRQRPLWTRGLTWVAYALMRMALLVTGQRY